MTRAPLIAALLAFPAWAEPHQISTNKSRTTSDTITLEAQTATLAHLTYDNHTDAVSVPGEYTLEHEGFRVVVRIKVNSGAAETVEVTPAPGFVASPEIAEVGDGEAVTIAIELAAF